MKQLIILCILSVFATSCGNNKNSASADEGAASTNTATAPAEDKKAVDTKPYDPKRGEGKFTKVDIAAKLDDAKATGGQKVYEVKCSGCHKLTAEKLVGPGWLGVTTRHAPEWIMNFITNTDEMISKDPKAQAQLELCLVRMPNQNLSDDDARNLLEFMRRNDGVK